MSTIETGHYDRQGIPIYVGDLIRVPHYRHVRNRRQMWMYFRVGQIGSRFVVHNWNDIDQSKHQCLLEDVLPCEVIAESEIHYNERGYLTTFNERPRMKSTTAAKPQRDGE